MTFARLPALTLGMVAAALQVVSGLFLHLTPAETGGINAVIVALLGLGTAWLVKGDALVAALVGVGQAAIALALGFGLDMAPGTQAAVMALVAAVSAAYVHTQVIGPIAPLPGSSPLEPSTGAPPLPS